MKNIGTWLITFSIFSAIFLSASFLAREFLDRDKPQPTVIGTTDYSKYPSVNNVAPTIAVVDQQYRYDISIVDSDTPKEEISVELVENPSWIESYSLSIYGTPKIEDMGAHKVVYKISDGENSVFETFYVVVSESNENE